MASTVRIDSAKGWASGRARGWRRRRRRALRLWWGLCTCAAPLGAQDSARHLVPCSNHPLSRGLSSIFVTPPGYGRPQPRWQVAGPEPAPPPLIRRSFPSNITRLAPIRLDSSVCRVIRAPETPVSSRDPPSSHPFASRIALHAPKNKTVVQKR